MEERDYAAARRIGSWIAIVILVLTVGIGAMHGSTFASAPVGSAAGATSANQSLPSSNTLPKSNADSARNADGHAAVVATATDTPTTCGAPPTSVSPVLVGHVTWQGSAQPNPAQMQPLTVTLFMSNPTISRIDSPSWTTSAGGVFTMPVGGLYPGTYQWRVKGFRSQANTGTVDLSGGSVSVEMGLLRVGDANNDNLIGSLDFNALRSQFGQIGPSLSADFNNDGFVGAQDFNLLKINFGQGGSPDLCAMCPSGPSVSELSGSGNPVEGRTFHGYSIAESDPDGKLDAATGGLSESSVDLSVPGRGPAMGFSRTYSSLQANVSGPLGFGWTHNYNMYIEGTANAVVHQEDGSTAPFTGSGAPGSSYSHDARVLAELSRNPDGTYVFTHAGDLTRYTFSAQGKLTGITDRDNYLTSLSYDSSGQLSTVTDPSGRTIGFIYACSLVVGLSGPGGQTVSFTYDPSGNPSTVTDVAGNVTHYSYDTGHHMLSMTDPNGGTTNYTYDALGRVVQAHDAMSRTTQITYTTQFPSNVITITNPRNNVISETYLSNRLVSAVQNPGTTQQASWLFTFGGGYVSGLASMTDPNNDTWSSTWDSRGNKLSSTDPLSRVTRYTYDATNDLTIVTDTLGTGTRYTYNTGGSRLSMARTLTQTGQVALTTYGYDAAQPGDMLSMTDPLGRTSSFSYDAYGYPLIATDPLSHSTHHATDVLGRVLSTTSARGSTSSFAYDAYGDVTVITDPLGYTTTYTYDPNRNIGSAQDANGQVTTYQYNPDNELVQENRPDGTHSNYDYDSAGNMVSQTNGLGQTTSYTYDSFERMVSSTDALGRTTSYTYDPAGRLTTMTDPQGRTTTLGYNAANEHTSTLYSDGTTHDVTFTYDNAGRRTQMTDATGTTLLNYDSLDRLRRSQDGAGKIVRYSYDLSDNLTALVYPSNALTVTYGYDDADRLTSVNDGLGHVTQYGYDVDGDPTSIFYPNGVTAAIEYDPDGDITSINHGSGTTSVLSLNYQRTGKGLLSVANESGAGISGLESHIYGLDGLDRLLSDRVTSSTSFNNRMWTYDGAFQIPQTIIESGSAPPTFTTRSHDAANELTHLTEMRGPVVSRDLSFLYNLDGDRTQQIDNFAGSAINLEYDQADRLTNYNGLAQYAYNGDGMRMTKMQSGSTERYTWSLQSRPMGSTAMLDSQTLEVTHYVYGLGGTPLEQVAPGGQVYFYHADQSGSVRAITDISGQVANTYTYEPYGALTASSGTVSNPFGYHGKFTDAESGLVSMGSRYYDPATQQFLTVDPLVSGTEHAYAFAGDDPINATAQTGPEVARWHFIRGSQQSMVSGPSLDRRNDSGLLAREIDEVGIEWKDIPGGLHLTGGDLGQPVGGAGYVGSSKDDFHSVRAVPGRLKWQVITLKRGITESMDAWKWRKMVEEGKVDNESAAAYKRGITESMDAWKWRKMVEEGTMKQVPGRLKWQIINLK